MKARRKAPYGVMNDDELSAFTNEDEARRHFTGATVNLLMNGGTWSDLFAVLALLRKGRNFLATPKLGLAKSACLVEFKYFAGDLAKRRHKETCVKPDAETVAQAKRYRDSLPACPGWHFEVETAVVEV